MRIWLLHIGEHLPVDGPVRSCRYGYLAKALVDAGHEVLRWAPTFRHVGKTHRYASDQRVQVAPHYAIQFVYAPGYQRNVGLARLRSYHILGRRLRELAQQERPPDLIVAAIPSLEWATAAIDYGAARGVPVVIDVRDLWPDVFLNALPAIAQPLGRRVLAPYIHMARRACREATALAAVSEEYLDWALRLAGRDRSPRDQVVPLGFEPEAVPRHIFQTNRHSLLDRGIDPNQPACLFAGLLERSYDLETVIGACERLNAGSRTKLQLIVCGDGSRAAAVARRAAGLRYVHLLGWVDAAMLQAVASISSIGLCAYAHDALQSLPNKPFEYMANGLAIASSLPGELADLLEQHRCGFSYRAGDERDCTAVLSRFVTSPPLLNAFRHNALDAWSRHYRSRDIYARFVEHLASLTRVTRAAKAA